MPRCPIAGDINAIQASEELFRLRGKNVTVTCELKAALKHATFMQK